MLSFFQLNFYIFPTLLIFNGVMAYGFVKANKQYSKIILLFMALGDLAFAGTLISNTVHNQVGKTTIDRSLLESTTNKYQESLNNKDSK